MKTRCLYPSHKSYPNYGGRGIKVCERWSDFGAFVSDMGDRPSPRHTLDRIDSNGHYEPGNVRWATMKEQRANVRPFNRVALRKHVLIDYVCSCGAVRRGNGGRQGHITYHRVRGETFSFVQQIRRNAGKDEEK